MAVFTSTCDLLTDFSGTNISSGHTLTAGGSSGNPGGCLTYTVTTTSSETSVRVSKSTFGVRSLEFDFKIDSAATLAGSGNQALVHWWTDSFAANLMELRIKSVASATKYQFFFTNSGGASTIMTVPNQLAKGTWYRLKIQITDAKIIFRIDGVIAAISTSANLSAASVTLTSNNMAIAAIGAYFSSIITGSFYVDNVTADAPTAPTAATTDGTKLTSVWAQYKTDRIRADGCPIRPYPDGADGSFAAWTDTTSETVGYILNNAVDLNDQTTFNSVAAWAYSNMRRGAASVANVTNLYCWHWNTESNTYYDSNTALDGDLHIMRAYYKAHSRWGSGGTINYLVRANAMSADLIGQAYTNGSFKYIPSDYSQGLTSPFEVNISYYDLVAMEYARHFDLANSAAWGQAIAGSYDMASANIAFLYSPQVSACGLVADWGKWAPATRAWTAGSRGNPDDYAYESFRFMYHIKAHHVMTGNATATTILATAKTFLTNYWSVNSAIAATYNHDGSTTGVYDASIFYYAAYQCLTINDPSNSTAAAIYSAKLASIYAANVEGHMYQDAPSSAATSYFAASWGLQGEIQRQGRLWNFYPLVSTQAMMGI